MNYELGVSHPSYGQCLVGTLATWQAHNDAQDCFSIMPGILNGDNMPEGGVWHFQLQLRENRGLRLPVDVTWDQVENGLFLRAFEIGGDALHQEIVNGSFPEDDSLVPRLNIIMRNLENHGQSFDVSAQDIVDQAYESLCF